MERILRHGDVISCEDLVKIIEKFGGQEAWIDGGFPQSFELDELKTCRDEKYKVEMNYFNSPNFHLVTDKDYREIITCGVRGEVCTELKEWVVKVNC